MARATLSRVFSAVAFVALVLFPSQASCHAIGVSRGEYVARGGGLFAKLVFARAEIATLVPSLDDNHDGHVTSREVQRARPDLAQGLLARIVVASKGAPCPAVLVDAGLVEEDGLSVSALFACASSDSPFSVDVRVFDAFTPGHRHVARVGGPSPRETMLSKDESTFTVDAPLPEAASAPAVPSVERRPPGSLVFFRMGIEHILTGWDHLVFLLGLVLLRARLRSLAAVVTAFTVGHSITLALAVTGLVVPSSRIVEPAIALSIAYVGVDNLLGKDGSRRWRITLPFGLIHGFGFAGALRALDLSRSELAGALVSFNVGVEVGQLAILLVLVPSLRQLREKAWFESRVTRALSGAIVLAGVVWFVARVASPG